MASPPKSSSVLACREPESVWAPFKVQAKKDRKTLDFECALTEDIHTVNIAALMAQCDTSRMGEDLYIEYEAKINLFMAMPGMQQPAPAVVCTCSAAGAVLSEEEGFRALQCNSEQVHSAGCFIEMSTLSSLHAA